jgi:hypothetical protein
MRRRVTFDGKPAMRKTVIEPFGAAPATAPNVSDARRRKGSNFSFWAATGSEALKR